MAKYVAYLTNLLQRKLHEKVSKQKQLASVHMYPSEQNDTLK